MKTSYKYPADTVSSAAITQARVPAPRRPSGSIRRVMKNLPAIADMPVNTVREAALAGVVFSTMAGSGGPTGLRQTGQATGGNQPWVFEQFNPTRPLQGRQRRRHSDFLRIDHQCPGERATRLLKAPHADQPAWRFRHPVTDHEYQHEGRQAYQEQVAPTD